MHSKGNKQDQYTAEIEHEQPGFRLAMALSGMRGMTSFLVSAFPMGLIGGVLGVTSGLGGVKTLALAMIANSGTAQFVAIRLLQERASGTAIVVTVLILSLRLLMYGVMLRPHTRPLSPPWRAVLGFFLIDAVFFVVIERLKGEERTRAGWQWFYLGAAAAMYINWMVATVIGIAVGASLPKGLIYGLDFPMTAVFAAMLAGALTNWRYCVAALFAAAVGVIANPLPYNLGLILAALIGAFAGIACDALQKPQLSGRQGV